MFRFDINTTNIRALQSPKAKLQQGKPDLHGVIFTNECRTTLLQMDTLVTLTLRVPRGRRQLFTGVPETGA